MDETGPVHLTRHHGLGNDFLITFADEVPYGAPELARRLCHRTDGIGADGLVFGTPDDVHDRSFTLFNSDGSRAELSGNGLRCFGQALLRESVTDGIDLVVGTAAGPRRVVVDGSPADEEVLATVEMGSAGPGPSFDGLEVDLGGQEVRRMESADVGNPHLVVLVDDPDTVDLGRVGPVVEAAFAPVGCNVNLVSVQDRSEVRLRTWERGAGLTEACGTGACASAHVLRSWGLVDEVVAVHMPGGRATVTVADPILLTGPAVHVDDHDVDPVVTPDG